MSDLDLALSFKTKPIHLVVKANHEIVIQHELNRVPAGWLMIDSTAPVNIWRSGAMNKTVLELTADQDADIILVLL